MSKINLVESEGIDVSKYAGNRYKIAGYSPYESQYNEDGKVSFKVFTEVIDTIPREEGEDIQIRASRIFNFKQAQDGSLNLYKDSKAAAFFTKLKVGDLDECVGKEVRVEENNKGFLTIEA